jgi:hypothetical protein
MQTCGADYEVALSRLVVGREAEAGRPSSAPAHPRLASPKLTQIGTNPTTLHALTRESRGNAPTRRRGTRSVEKRSLARHFRLLRS